MQLSTMQLYGGCYILLEDIILFLAKLGNVNITQVI